MEGEYQRRRILFLVSNKLSSSLQCNAHIALPILVSTIIFLKWRNALKQAITKNEFLKKIHMDTNTSLSFSSCMFPVSYQRKHPVQQSQVTLGFSPPQSAVRISNLMPGSPPSVSVLRSQISAGITPARPVPCKYNASKRVSRPNTVGMVPVMALLKKESNRRSVNDPR